MRRPILLAGFLTLLALPAAAATPWIPVEGDLEVGTSFQFEAFDELYEGSSLVPFPPGNLDQASTRLYLDYGLWEDFAVDARIGWTGTFSQGASGTNGLDDTYLGLSWRVLDELGADNRWVPTLTLRAAAIIAGTYDASTFPVAPGDGASGGEFELAIGKLAGRGFAASLVGGYRVRNNNVPDDWKIRVGLSQTLFDRLTLGLGFLQDTSISGLDVDDPGFGPGLAPQLREIYSNIEAWVGLVDSRGVNYDVGYAHTLAGRNVGKKHIVSFLVTIPFDLRRGLER
jgi:hypothetical protein